MPVANHQSGALRPAARYPPPAPRPRLAGRVAQRGWLIPPIEKATQTSGGFLFLRLGDRDSNPNCVIQSHIVSYSYNSTLFERIESNQPMISSHQKRRFIRCFWSQMETKHIKVSQMKSAPPPESMRVWTTFHLW
jgi:hypothetical protein